MPMRWQAGTGPSQLHLMATSLPLRRFCFCSKLSAALAGCSAERRAAACLLLNVQDSLRMLQLLLPSHQHRPAAVVTVAQQSRAEPRTDSTPGGGPASRRLLPAFQACRRLSHLCPAGPPLSSYPLLQLLHVSSCLMSFCKCSMMPIFNRLELRNRLLSFTFSLYESFSDVGEIRVYFASKILTPCRMY